MAAEESLRLIKVGMRLEAVSSDTPSFLCVAYVKAIDDDDGKLLISFDNWGDTYDYWDKPTSPHLYPCGFLQYVVENKLLGKLTEDRGRQKTMSPSIYRPSGSSLKASPFPWKQYLESLRADDPLGMFDPVPTKCLDVSRFYGFSPVNEIDVSENAVAETMRLEAVDKQNPQLICVASVKAVHNSQEFLVSFDGWTDGFDYTTTLNSDLMFPCGFMDYLKKNNLFPTFKATMGHEVNQLLQKPRGSNYPDDPFPWKKYLKDIKARPVPFHLFDSSKLYGFTEQMFRKTPRDVTKSRSKTVSTSHNGEVKVGMRLEAVSSVTPSYLCVAYIKSIAADGEWLIAFDDWSDVYDFWAEPLSHDLYPCGFLEYCNENDLLQALSADRKHTMVKAMYLPSGSELPNNPFPWDTYLAGLRAKNPDGMYDYVPRKVFEQSRLFGFVEQVPEHGMRLEAVDINNPSLVCVATIKEINDKGKWLITFDGWNADFDYWAEPGAKGLYPCGFMAYVKENNLFSKLDADRGTKMTRSLQAPKGSDYSGDPFPWHQYLTDVGAKRVPFSSFNQNTLYGLTETLLSAESMPKVIPEMRLEAVDIKTPSLICVATVKAVDKSGRWLIGFDGWSTNYDYWTKPLAHELFPCGFMEYAAKNNLLDQLSKDRKKKMNNRLQAPNGSNYKSDPFPWEQYFKDLKRGNPGSVAQPVPFECFEKSHLYGMRNIFSQICESLLALESMSPSSNVEQMKLRNLPGLKESDFRRLALIGIKTLTDVDVSFCPNITDQAVRLIADCSPSLKLFDGSGCRQVTEQSVGLLAKCAKLSSAKLNFTSARYIPSNTPSKIFTFERCPLMVEESQLPKGTKFPNDLPPSMTSAKIVIVKPDKMANVFVGKSFANPNKGDTMAGQHSLACCYHSGRYCIVECVENSLVPLLVTDNCLVVLPFFLTDAAEEIVDSLLTRFELVARLGRNLRAVGLPMTDPSSSASVHDLSALQARVDVLCREVADRGGTEVKAQFGQDFNMVWAPEHVMQWAARNAGHSNVPKSVYLLTQAFEKAKTALNLNQKPFFTINDLAKNLGVANANVQSLVSYLAETGNCWLEAFFGTNDGPTVGSNHAATQLKSFVSFLNSLLNATEKRTTAMMEGITFLAADTPLLEVDKLKQLIGLDDEACWRLMNYFEYLGLLTFRQHTALIFGCLRNKPPIKPEHFTTEATNKSTLNRLVYKLACHPSVLFPTLAAAISKVIPPALLWQSGALFTETVLEILILFDDYEKRMEVVLVTDRCVTEDSSTGKTTSLNVTVHYTKSLVHTICCLVLQPFSNADCISLGKSQGLDFLGDANHTLKALSGLETFSRRLDPTIARCSTCFLGLSAVSLLHRFSLRKGIVSKETLHPQANELQVGMNLGSWQLTGPAGVSGLPPRFVEILNVGNVTSVKIFVGNSTDKSLVVNFANGKVVEEPRSAKSDKKSKTPPKPQVMVTSGLRIEARLTKEGTVAVGVSSGGMTIREATLSEIGQSSLVSVVMSMDSKEGLGPAVFHAPSSDEELAGSSISGGVFPGMRLEAVDFIYPSLIAVARLVAQDETTGKWKLKFDGWGPRFDQMIDVCDKHLFPCGFMEYAARTPGVLDKVSAMREKNMTTQLQRPKNSSYSQAPFPWLRYFADVKAENEKKGITDETVEAVPLEFFETSHLFGFEKDPYCMQYMKGKEHAATLTAFAVNAKNQMLSLIETENLLGHRTFFVPLPELTWPLVIWPSRDKLVDGEQTLPHFVCAWPDFPHFVNEPAVSGSPISLSAPHALSLAAVLKKMIEQPRFIPDEFSQIFQTLLQTDAPAAYPFLEMSKPSGKDDKARWIEQCLRRKLFPFILDYLTLIYAIGLDKAQKTKVDDLIKSQLERLKPESGQESRWACVTVTSAQPKPRSYLLNMKEAEPDFFVKNEDCPRLLCGQHAYFYTTFAKATEFGIRFDWESSINNFGNFHDPFVTHCALNESDVPALKKPLCASYPHMLSFVGLLSASLEESGVLSAKWLCQLILDNNKLSALPDSLGSLENCLQRLDLSRNSFTAIPTCVYRLRELEHLKLDDMSIDSIDDKIKNLSKLKSLSIRNNCIGKLPVGFFTLSKLESIELPGMPSVPLSSKASNMHMEEVGAFMENNNFPQYVYDKVISWSEDENLTSLDRGGVEKLNRMLFKVIPRLRMENPTSPFPLGLETFPKLTNLNLANQAIQGIPDHIGQLTSLKRLDLSGCLILSSISSKVANCPFERFNLDNCPELKTPPIEIRKRGLADTMKFFQRLEEGSVKCKRTKLMFVGLGGAGKTTLVSALTSGGKKPGKPFDVTDGIDITKWAVEDVDFRMWDFAGQVVYYNTHQFFISHRAVYLLLWNIRLGHEHAGLEFWLSSIASHAPSAPILIVGTHADEVAQERSFFPEVEYRMRFESISGFHYVSSHTGQGIKALQDDILKVALAQKHMGESVPVSWLHFENLLLEPRYKNSSTPEPFLMLDEVEAVAQKNGIFTQDELDQSLQFLSDMGSIQYFHTDFLRDRVIVNPQWIVDVMAKVVSVKNTQHVTEGKLDHSSIPVIWAAYPETMHAWLLKLTEAFDLTFPLKNQNASIVPCLLPENPPGSLSFPSLEDNANCHLTKLVFSFKYLPTGLFNRIQVRLCQFSDGATMWRRGSLLRKNTHYALITQPDHTSIHVKVNGPCPENIAFLILEVVDTLIYESFQGVQPDYLFACPACVSARVADPSMFKRSRIRRAHELRIPFLQCWNYFHSVSTQELRQLFPPESSAEFETQFYRTMQEISSIKQKLKIDVLVIGCLADGDPKEMKTCVSTSEVGEDVQKSFPDFRVVTIANPDAESDAVSYDHLGVMMRMARVVVFCLSEQFMHSDRCQAAFFTGRETLKKDVVIVLVREFDLLKFSALAFQMTGDIYVKAISRTRYKARDVANKIQMCLDKTSGSQSQASLQSKKHPEVFISYCWQNSRDAVSKGSRANAKALGVTDPRELKKFLADNGFNCWLDTEQLGLGGLFRDIADGIRNAHVVVVCVSDEYTRSENCLREFHFATTSLRRPVILCPVGTGIAWQTSEVNLIVCQAATTINFQVDVKANYDLLVKTVRPHVKTGDDSDAAEAPQTLSKLGRHKTSLNVTGKEESSAAQKSLVLQEIIELGQRKMLRQLASFANAADSRPYPRLILLDIIDETEEAAAEAATKPQRPATAKSVKLENDPKVEEDEEYMDEFDEEEERIGFVQDHNVELDQVKDNMRDENDPFAKLKWRVRFLCEHEAGWHSTSVSLPLTADTDAGQLFRNYAGYFGPMLTFIRQSAGNSLELYQNESKECAEVQGQIEQMIASDQETFQEHYVALRAFATHLDRDNNCGGLRKCLLTLGKELWLCEEHRNAVDSRSKEKEKEAAAKPRNEAPTTSNNPVDQSGTADASDHVKLLGLSRPKFEDPRFKNSRACSLQ